MDYAHIIYTYIQAHAHFHTQTHARANTIHHAKSIHRQMRSCTPLEVRCFISSVYLYTAHPSVTFRLLIHVAER